MGSRRGETPGCAGAVEATPFSGEEVRSLSFLFKAGRDLLAVGSICVEVTRVNDYRRTVVERKRSCMLKELM